MWIIGGLLALMLAAWFIALSQFPEHASKPALKIKLDPPYPADPDPVPHKEPAAKESPPPVNEDIQRKRPAVREFWFSSQHATPWQCIPPESQWRISEWGLIELAMGAGAPPRAIFDIPAGASAVSFEGGKPQWLFAGPEVYTPAEPEPLCACGDCNCAESPICECKQPGCCDEQPEVLPEPAVEPEPTVAPKPDAPCVNMPEPRQCKPQRSCRPRFRLFRNRCRSEF
jgi:hypothetical protein